MTRARVADPVRDGSAGVRIVGSVLLAALAFVVWLKPTFLARVETAWFDALQRLSPRQVDALPVVIVAVDDRSIAAMGQWPWPRTVLAAIIENVATASPAAIGIDVLMPEPDRLSPSNDAALARSLARMPAVLALVGTRQPTFDVLRAPPVLVRNERPSPDWTVDLPRFTGVVGSLDELDRTAQGHGLISVTANDGVVRRVPLLFDVGGTLAPALALELIRVAQRANAIRVSAHGSVVTEIQIDAWRTRTENDGSVRIYYAHRDARRFVSAIDVLNRTAAEELFNRKLVLIGATGIGLVDEQSTPLEPMPGIEVQAQLLENLFGATLLFRPDWAPAAELAWLIALGAMLIYAVPRWTPRDAALLAVGAIAFPLLVAWGAFRSHRWLIDAATPSLAIVLLFGTLIVLTLREATLRMIRLERAMRREREQAARMAGELEAAQRIQAGMLPRADLLHGDARIDLAATMTPAREVGGDLYDFYLLDGRRLFLLVGDVSGKGLSASIFMAVSKALCKSVVLRSDNADVGTLMSAANVEVSRDNSDSLFVTAFAAILDLDTGELEYCNAGHEDPFIANAGVLERVSEGGGPPLCALDAFDYPSERLQLARGQWVCCFTDGVVDECNDAGERYGLPRFEASLTNALSTSNTARELVDRIRGDIEAFVGRAEPADDMTILVLRWNGRAADGTA